MILQLMDCETTVQGLTQEMSAVEMTHYGLASPARVIIATPTIYLDTSLRD